MDALAFLNAQVGQAIPTPENFDLLFPPFNFDDFEFARLNNWHYTPDMEDVRDRLKRNCLDGARCPTCAQGVNIMRRSPYREPGEWLRRLHEEIDRTGKPFLNGQDLGSPGGDYAKWRFWHMIRKGPRGGLWGGTPFGSDFVKGKFGIPRYAYFYNNRCLGFSGAKDLITFNDVLGISKDESEVIVTVEKTVVTIKR